MGKDLGDNLVVSRLEVYFTVDRTVFIDDLVEPGFRDFLLRSNSTDDELQAILVRAVKVAEISLVKLSDQNG